MISIQKVNKSYGNKEIIKNINLDIKEKCITSIIGPNGAGKSTLLGMVSRTLKRDSGHIFLNYKDILEWDTNALAKKLSLLKQSGTISARITIKELVEFGRYPYNKGKLTCQDNEIVNRSLEYMDLIDFQDRYLEELSGGQRQRAYIASLLAQDTDYILLDEPLNNLDMKYASGLLKVLRKLVKELGKTIVIVIHDINIAACYSDYIILLKDGNLFKHGTVDEVMKNNILEEVYDMKFKIKDFDGQLICSYY